MPDENLLSELVNSDYDIELIANGLRARQVDKNTINTITSKIQAMREQASQQQPKVVVAQEVSPQVSEPQVIETQEVAPQVNLSQDVAPQVDDPQVMAARPMATEEQSVMPFDAITQLANEDYSMDQIISGLKARGVSDDNIKSITDQINSIRQPQELVGEGQVIGVDVAPERDNKNLYVKGSYRPSLTKVAKDMSPSEKRWRQSVSNVATRDQDIAGALERQKLSEDSEIAANIISEHRNLTFTNQQFLRETLDLYSSEEIDKIRRQNLKYTQEIADSLRAANIDVIGIANYIPQQTADGDTMFGDIVYRDKDGNKRIADEDFWSGISAAKGEAVGGISGGIAGAKLLGSASGGNPVLTAAGGIIGGAIGAYGGAVADTFMNSWKLKKEIDGKLAARKALDAAVFDPIYGGAAVGVGLLVKGLGKVGAATGRSLLTKEGRVNLAKKINNFLMHQEKGAKKFFDDNILDSPEVIRQKVELHNRLTGRELDPNNKMDVIRAYVEDGDSRIIEQISLAAAKAETSGARLYQDLIDEVTDMKSEFVTGADPKLVNTLLSKMQNYKRSVSNYISDIKEVGGELVDEAVEAGMDPFVLNISKELDPLLDDILAGSKNILNDDAFTRLKNNIERIKRAGSAETSELGKTVAEKKAQAKKTFIDIKDFQKETQLVETEAVKKANLEFIKNKNQLQSEIESLKGQLVEPGADKTTIRESIKSKQLELNTLKKQRSEDMAEVVLGQAQNKRVFESIKKQSEAGIKELDEIGEEEIKLTFGITDGGFRDTLDLLSYLSSLKRDTSLIKNVDVVDAIGKMENKVKNTIRKAAIDYMGESDGKLWFDQYTRSRREWASYNELTKNKIHEALLSPEANYDEVIKRTKASIPQIKRNYAQVYDRLTPVQRVNLEKAIYNNILDDNTTKAGDAINWSGMFDSLKNMDFKTKEGKNYKRVAMLYANRVGNRIPLAEAIGQAAAPGAGATLATSPKGMARMAAARNAFELLRGKLAWTTTQKKIGFITEVSKILDNPMETKTVRNFINEMKDVMPEQEAWNMVRAIQEEVRQFGSLRRYGIDTQIYAKTISGDPPKKGELRHLSATEEAAPGKGDVYEFNVDPKQIASKEDIEAIMGRKYEASDLNDREVWKKLEENNFMGINLSDKDPNVWILPHGFFN
jgi:hypothetical protein